jgi:hypothetical protein
MGKASIRGGCESHENRRHQDYRSTERQIIDLIDNLRAEVDAKIDCLKEYSNDLDYIRNQYVKNE